MAIDIGKQTAKVTGAAAAVGTAARKGIERIPGRESARDRIQSLAKTAGLGAIAGAATAYVFDPDNGRRRRAMAVDRVTGFVRRGFRRASDRTDDERSAPNDQTLADRVRSQIFRPADVPKGSVSVNAEDGIVYLRGEVKRPEQIKALVSAAKDVEGVRAVENLLHTPGTEPKMKEETEPETRRRVRARAAK